jgi:hypothetical protein
LIYLIILEHGYLVSGLYPSSSVQTNWTSPVIETSSFQRAQLNRSTLPHPPEDRDRCSLRNVVFLSLLFFWTLDDV